MCFLGNKFSKNLGYFEILAHFFFRFFLNLIFSEILVPKYFGTSFELFGAFFQNQNLVLFFVLKYNCFLGKFRRKARVRLQFFNIIVSYESFVGKRVSVCSFLI